MSNSVNVLKGLRLQRIKYEERLKQARQRLNGSEPVDFIEAFNLVASCERIERIIDRIDMQIDELVASGVGELHG